MNLKALSQSELFSQTKAAIHEERLSTIKVLKHLREIERRRAFMQYSSLFEVAVHYFGYSAPAAQRRIQAMRLLKDAPEFESKIESGELSLMAASMAQSYFKRSNVKAESKALFLNSCLNKSKREVEKEIKRLEPEADKRQDIRYSTGERLRMSLNISEELYEKLEKLKYEFKAQNIEQVIERLIDERNAPVMKARPMINEACQKEQTSSVTAPKKFNQQSESVNAQSTSARVSTRIADHLAKTSTTKPNPLLPVEARVRHIPAVTKKIVIKRNPNQCSYKDESGKACEQRAKLEFDHIHPFSKGGTHTTDNLRLVCAHHNKVLWHQTQKKL